MVTYSSQTMIFFITLFIFSFVFVLPNQISVANTPACRESLCKINEPHVQFPFRLGDRQATYCGYGQGFDLSCSWDKRTILTLPISGNLIVKGIDYNHKLLLIDDPESCFPKRFLDGDFSLRDSPFSYPYGLENSTFINCSSTQAAIQSMPIPCLSSPYHTVLVVPSSWYYGDLDPTSMNSSPSPASLSPFCSVIVTALVPRSSSAHLCDINGGVLLAWDLPAWHRSLQESGCGLENDTNSTVCTGSANSDSRSGIPTRRLKYAIMIGFGVTAILCLVGVVICAYKMNASNQARQPAITELSTVASQQPPAITTHPPNVVKMGLDGETIESYPKTQLGESFELPNPYDKTCAICLCEYQQREIIRTIPQCKHYFHANCIDEWFKKDVTCPLCRDQPNYEALGLPRPPLQDTSALPDIGSLGFPRPILQNTSVQYLDHMYFM